MVEMKCVCVCVLRGVERGSIYSSRGRFPANAHMEGDQVPWQPLLLEVRLDGNQTSRPDLLLDGIFFDPYPSPLVHLAWRPRFL